MTQDDLNALRGIIKEEVSAIVKQEVSAIVKQEVSTSEKRLREEISASEKRLRGEISDSGQRLRKEISVSEQKLREEILASENRTKDEIKDSGNRLMLDIGTFVDDSLLPSISEKADKSDVERLERKVDKFMNNSLDQDRRIRDIEQIPAIAHELKKRK